MEIILISSYGLSVFGFVFALQMFCITSIPFTTRPNTVCLLSSHGYERYRISVNLCIFIGKPKKTNNKIHTYCGQNSDEKLTSIRVCASICHWHSVRSIMSKRWMEFIFEVTAPNRFTACSGAGWIASLNHETFDYTMEYVAIVVAVFAVHAEVLDCFRAFSSKKFHVNITASCVQRGRGVQFLNTWNFEMRWNQFMEEIEE